MQKSKHCFVRGSGHRRLSKADYDRMRPADAAAANVDEPPDIVPHKPPWMRKSHWLWTDVGHEWVTPDGIHMTCGPFQCPAGCDAEPDHMYTITTSNIDWTDPAQATLEPERRWVWVHFACRRHLLSRMNSDFGGGGSLSNHWYRTHDRKWARFKDVHFLTGLPETDTPPATFTLNSSNYKRVLRSHSQTLAGKRNFTFYFCSCNSHRRTGFCCVDCDNRRDGDACGHPTYVDHEWDAAWDAGLRFADPVLPGVVYP